MVAGKRARQDTPKVVSADHTAEALAKAVCNGNIVDFRLLFLPFSPARRTSSEMFETNKYAYLLPDEATTSNPRFQTALKAVRRQDLWRHIEAELQADRPAQLPSDLLLMLADNAVALGKYTSAAQAYEQLRIRDRMQEEFLVQADAALDEEDIRRGVRGYLIAAHLEYDYSAFPEPLPAVPNFQTKALMLHGEYPETPESSVPMQELDVFLRVGLGYLLANATIASRLDERPEAVRVAFFTDLVHRRDPRWSEFASRFRMACERAEGSPLQGLSAEGKGATLKEEVEEMRGKPTADLPGILLGEEIEHGEWWQYLKELARNHPPAALFVARQVVGEAEILVPRYRPDSPIPRGLSLTPQDGG